MKRIAPIVDAMIVVGSSNSSNSQRLREVAERSGCKLARLVLRADDVDWDLFKDVKSVGITAGASAPEVLVEEIMDAFAARFELNIEIVSTADESVFFPLPRELRPLNGASRRGRAGGAQTEDQTDDTIQVEEELREH